MEGDMGQANIAEDKKPIILIRILGNPENGTDKNDYEILVKSSGTEETKFIAGTFTPQTLKKLREAD
jgi:hypothetical protein